MTLSCARRFKARRFRWMIAGGLKEGIKENFIQITNNINGLKAFLAEEAGFEPAIRFPVYTLSRRAP